MADNLGMSKQDLLDRLTHTLGSSPDLFDVVYRDPLHPQLLNRKAFDRIAESFAVSVTFADADGLKRVNDSQGYGAGDAFLRSIVDTWATVTRSGERSDSLVFRLGGDEFAVVWFCSSDQGHQRLADAWASQFQGSDTMGVSSANVEVQGSLPQALVHAQDVVKDSKAGRARTEVEELRARVAELEAQLSALQ